MVHYLNVMEELRNGGGGHNINGDDGDEESEDKHSKKLEEAKGYVDDLRKDNASPGELMARLITDIENNREAYRTSIYQSYWRI